MWVGINKKQQNETLIWKNPNHASGIRAFVFYSSKNFLTFSKIFLVSISVYSCMTLEFMMTQEISLKIACTK